MSYQPPKRPSAAQALAQSLNQPLSASAAYTPWPQPQDRLWDYVRMATEIARAVNAIRLIGAAYPLLLEPHLLDTPVQCMSPYCSSTTHIFIGVLEDALHLLRRRADALPPPSESVDAQQYSIAANSAASSAKLWEWAQGDTRVRDALARCIQDAAPEDTRLIYALCGAHVPLHGPVSYKTLVGAAMLHDSTRCGHPCVPTSYDWNTTYTP